MYKITGVLIFAFCLICSTANSLLIGQTNNHPPRVITYSVGYMNNVFSDVDLNDARAALKIWVNETIRLYTGPADYHINNVFYESFKELDRNIINDRVAFLSLSAYDYLSNERKYSLEPVLVPEIEGSLGVEYCILVSKSSQIKNIRELKGRTLGLLSNPIYMASRLWLDVLLSKNSLPQKEKFFGRIEGAAKESQNILGLFFGNLEVCVVPVKSFQLMCELNPQVGQKLEIIQTSPVYVPGLMCYVPAAGDEQFRKHFYDSTKKLHEHNAGRQMLALLKIGKLVPFKEEYLANFKALIKEHKKVSSNAR